MPKVLWVALPVALYAGYVALRALRQRTPTRRALNVNTSLLLLIYFGATAGLGVFWVAEQQLPVFDLHYLFGYTSLALVVLHLVFNLPQVVRFFRRRRGRGREPSQAGPEAAGAERADRRGASPAPRRAVWTWLAVTVGLVAAFTLGMRHARRSPSWGPAKPASGASAAPAEGSGLAARVRDGALGPTEWIDRYHESSSTSRLGAFTRGPSVDWGSRPPAFKGYPGRPYTELPRPGAAAVAGRSLSEAIGGAAPPQAAEPVPAEPVPAEPVPAEPPSPRTLTLAGLSELLFHSAGITADRGNLKLRAAPSSGALFATELYLAAHHVEGLEPGLYHYDPERHGLHLLRAGSIGLSALGAPHAVALEREPVTVVLTAIVRRVGHKYGDRAYRYLVEDAGHAFENLRITAAELGWRAELLDRFDESLTAASLGVDGVEEVVLALGALRAPGAQPIAARPAPGAPDRTMVAYDYATTAEQPPSMALGATALAHLATTLRLAPPSAPAAPSSAEPAPGPTVPLPEPTIAPGRALQTIAVRRSQRRYADTPVSLETIASLLHDAMSPAPVISNRVSLSVVANRVVDLEPGIYRYHPTRHELAQLRAGDLHDETASAGLGQDVVGAAAAVFMLTVDRQQLLAADGARGYRHALLEIGAIGERLALGAVARSLGACPVGAFYDDDAQALLGTDPEREWIMHWVALGSLE